MPSFDVVSEVDTQELVNAVDQANREVGIRFDFKGTDAKFDLNESVVTLHAPVEFQLQQMLDILQSKMVKRKIDIACMDVAEPEIALNHAKQKVTIRQGLETVLAKKLVKIIKDSKMKVQAAIQGDKIRVTGKKRDDLQQVMTLLTDADCGMPLQYDNFRD